MAATDFFVGEIATELMKAVFHITKKSVVCKSRAKHLSATIAQYLDTVQEIKYSGNELPEARQCQLDRVSELMTRGLELCHKIMNSSRWNAYKNLPYARKLEKIDKSITSFIQSSLQLYIAADINNLSFKVDETFDSLDCTLRRLESEVSDMRIRSGERFDRLDGSMSRLESRVTDMRIESGERFDGLDGSMSRLESMFTDMRFDRLVFGSILFVLSVFVMVLMYKSGNIKC